MDDSALYRDWFWIAVVQTAGSVLTTVKHRWRAGILTYCSQCPSIFVEDVSSKPLVQIIPF